ncbi:TrbG/VirB9 family P-type conjugative transfer protein [Methylovirgula sp. 4M-Z18]|uniref:TrbG/VirB9 family P-type conjugative transfer protein n=1 Tax=Methylovirgula sp. 4M-Z18 TaxID=2293567 RepID=UPI000E2FDA84|nr:TrbG/VirB9 family P-type conjugative transfer protein [Methylovirgula sp. 4M-Z18]RFB76674.1 P-type conjugative transfer protein VirB9 [Methylovirgula sp. 4M-Z18]
MRHSFLSCLVLVALTPSAHAEISNSHIQYSNYDPNLIPTLHAYPGIASEIIFKGDENIVDAASGFGSGWELSPRGHILFIKPKTVKSADKETAAILPTPDQWATNLLVTTDKHTYAFDLKLVGSPQEATYALYIKYPAEEAAAARELARQRAAERKLAQRAPPQNWNYSMAVGANADNIRPSSAWDDGHFTYLRFPGNGDFPSVFLVGADGKESIIDHHVEGDTLVVHRVARALMLRSGDSAVGVYNEAFDAVGVPPQGGSTVPDIARTFKKKLPFANGRQETTGKAVAAPPSTSSAMPALPTPAAPVQGQ